MLEQHSPVAPEAAPVSRLFDDPECGYLACLKACTAFDALPGDSAGPAGIAPAAIGRRPCPPS